MYPKYILTTFVEHFFQNISLGGFSLNEAGGEHPHPGYFQPPTIMYGPRIDLFPIF